MTTMDQINQQIIASYLREAVWPTYKMLPKSCSKWRDDKRSLYQMILNKVAVPVGVDPKSYCDTMLLGITNDKYCSLRSNFKQEMFEQFQGKILKVFPFGTMYPFGTITKCQRWSIISHIG